MIVLCIETSTSVCSAAVCKDGKPLKQCICLEGSNHARLLPLYIEELLHFAKQQSLSIDAVGLSEGPGSYTGLRIGTYTAKGLCYGLNVPLIPVPTLQVLCAAAKDKLPITNDQSPLLLPLIDARRMEVYTALYDMDLHPLSEVKAVVVENEESFSGAVCQQVNLGLSAGQPGSVLCQSEGRSVFFFGDGAAKCQSVLTNPDWHYIPDIVPEARYVGVLAEQIVHRQSSNRQSVDLAYYEPYYLKEFIAAQSHVKGLK